MILNGNICLNIWNEKKEKNITESYLLEPHKGRVLEEEVYVMISNN